MQNYRKDSANGKTQVYFKKRFQQIEELRSAFVVAHEQVVNIAGYAESAYVTKHFQSEFEERYMDACCLFAEDQEKLVPAESKTSTVAAAVGPTAEARMTMPQMTVPKFLGAAVDWLGYFYAFNDLVYNNPSLTGMKKLNFLKESLPAGRDNDVRQMQLTCSYNNQRLVFAHHMSAICLLPKLQTESSEGLRTMLSTVNV